jgi:hypothetical protein
MADNHDFLEPTGTAPTDTIKRTIRAPEIGGVLHPVAILVDSAGAEIAPATEATLASGVGLRSDAIAQHGLFTLSAVAGTVLSIALPANARIIRLLVPSADLSWRIDADPAAPGSGALTDGGYALAGDITPILVPAGATTLRLRSAAASPTARIEVRL